MWFIYFLWISVFSLCVMVFSLAKDENPYRQSYTEQQLYTRHDAKLRFNNGTESKPDLPQEIAKMQPISETDAELPAKNANLQSQQEEFNPPSGFGIQPQQTRKIEKQFLIVMIILLLAGIILMFALLERKLITQKTKYRKKVASLQADKNFSEQKLKETHNALVAHQKYLNEKNRQILQLKNEIAQITASDAPEQLQKDNRQLEKLLQSHLMTKESWQNFKEAFVKENYSTYLEILNEFPHITESALRIELLQKLGLTNAETARILGITIDAVKKSKQRLRKNKFI